MNSGLLNETTIVESLNDKMVLELNDNLKNFIFFLFDNIKETDLIKSSKIKGKSKADIFININNRTKYISIKMGSENSVHSEKLDSFIFFLKNLKVKESVLNNLKLYHFGDNTIDGSGIKRYSAEECKIRYSKEIYVFNKYISYDNILVKIVDRFLFTGTENNRQVADVIYYGNSTYGLWITREDALNYFKTHKCFYMKSIHFSSLTYQNWCRNITLNKKSELHRNYIQIKWFSIVSDMQKISDNR